MRWLRGRSFWTTDQQILRHAPERWSGITVRHLLTQPPNHGLSKDFDFRRDTRSESQERRDSAGLRAGRESGTATWVRMLAYWSQWTASSRRLSSERIFSRGMNTARIINEAHRSNRAGVPPGEGELKNQEWVSLVKPQRREPLHTVSTWLMTLRCTPKSSQEIEPRQSWPP